METTLYKITFGDGRKFNVFCANKKQKQRLHRLMANNPLGGVTEASVNGIHDIKQFELIIKSLNK